MTDFELNIFTKVKELNELKKEEIKKSAAEFVLNPAIKKYDEEIANMQKQCEHRIIENNKCKICGKKMEENV